MPCFGPFRTNACPIYSAKSRQSAVNCARIRPPGNGVSDGEGTLTIRGKLILSLLAVACVGAAWLYLSPDALSKAQQLVGMKQVAAADKPAGDKAAAGDKEAAGGNGGHSAPI